MLTGLAAMLRGSHECVDDAEVHELQSGEIHAYAGAFAGELVKAAG